jgi:hypothetical protein
VRVAARAVTPAVILFLLVSSVTAFARTSFTSAFGFPGQEAEQVLTEAAQNMDADGFWNLDRISQIKRGEALGCARSNNYSIFKRLIVVEPDGIEPTTSSMPLKRSPN